MDITKDMPPCTLRVGGHRHYKLLTPNQGDVSWRSGAWLISVSECDQDARQRYTFIAANEYHAIAGMFSDILATMKLADGPTAGSA